MSNKPTSASAEAVRTARQLGYAGIAVVVVTVVMAIAGVGNSTVAIFGLAGFLVYATTQYIIGKYDRS